MGHPDFRINNRIFATLHHDQQFGMVKLTPDQQQKFMRDDPETFAPENGAWEGDLSVFTERPIALTFLLLTVAVIVLPLVFRRLRPVPPAI